MYHMIGFSYFRILSNTYFRIYTLISGYEIRNLGLNLGFLFQSVSLPTQYLFFDM